MEAATSSAQPPTANSTQGESRRKNNRYHGHRKPRPQQATPTVDDAGSSVQSAPAGSEAAAIDGSTQNKSTRRPPRPRKQVQGASQDAQPRSEGSTPESSATIKRPNSHRRPPRPQNASLPSNNGQPNSDRPQTPAQNPKPPGGGRQSKFKGKLTEGDAATGQARQKPFNKYRPRNDTVITDDLTGRLIREFTTPPYPDCPICFSTIRREEPIWSCSPSIPTILPPGAEGPAQYCWTTFHLKCIRSWASKNVKDLEDAWRARGEEGKQGDWRCPGCQGKREIVPKVYWCFCGTTPEPKPPRLSTPHSCGGPCSRVRESGCGHPCPLSCHPGPCPPCQVTTRLACYCPRKSIIAFRCGIDQERGGKGKNLSCGNVCGRTLGCGTHQCVDVCHEGPCNPCFVRDLARCYCGKSEKEIGCGEGKAEECFVEGEKPWIGRFTCNSICERSFDCGIHKCQKTCHAPSHAPALCPRSPSLVTHCPCGKSSIAPSPGSDLFQYDFPARAKCTSPIPTCNAICEKPHKCGHPCRAKCHQGSCPPCTFEITRPCRCGASTKSLPCHEIYNSDTGEEVELLCDRPCTVLLACGRHECRRICCPLASLAMNTGKKGKKRMVEDGPGLGEERGGLHECDRICEKPLSCGNHKCQERDHKGVCPPCLRSSFEEMICFCGRTVYEPPIPCGTVMRCTYPCPRPPPPCGHPRVPHQCHEDPYPCPPCASLTTKPCACGKKQMPNIRCSLESEKVSCGARCGKLLSCGFHHCERSCHAGDCGTCTATCGKLRKGCLPDHHLCTLPCHAPSSCPETDPCSSVIAVTCPCGRIKQAASCGKCRSQPQGDKRPSPLCTKECNIAIRNAKLAEALGINPTKSVVGLSSSVGGFGSLVNSVTYNDEVVAFARDNHRFLGVVEKAFAEFINAVNKKNTVLPHMPPEKRKFVHDLATYYRIDTQLIDQEPHRSVQLVRRLDTRLPTPLLSSIIQSTNSTPTPNLGKLGNLKSGGIGSPSSSSSNLGLPLSMSVSGGPFWRPTSASPRPGVPGTTTTMSTATSAGTSVARGWSTVAAPQPTRPSPGSSIRTDNSGWGQVSQPQTQVSRSNNGSPAVFGIGGNGNSGLRRNEGMMMGLSVESGGNDDDGGDVVPENWEDDS